MAKSELLTRTEEVILVAVAGVTGQPYGMKIFEECRRLTKGRYISIGSIYTILERLQKKGFVESWFEESGEPGHHSEKRCFRITDSGIAIVRETADLSRTLRLAWRTDPKSSGLHNKHHPAGDRRKDQLEARTHRAG